MIEQGQKAPDEVLKLIDEEETVWVRIAATRKDDEWQESLMEVTSGVAPDRWTVQRWEYTEAVFLSAEWAVNTQSLVPLVIQPRASAPRVVAQQSVMTLIPNIGKPTGFVHEVHKTMATRIRIRPEWMPEALDLCENLGLTRLELFRDLDSLGAALTKTVKENLSPFLEQ